MICVTCGGATLPILWKREVLQVCDECGELETRCTCPRAVQVQFTEAGT